MPKRKQKIEPWQVRDKRKRSKQTLPPRKRYLICAEGKSEAIYFAHYKSSTGPVVISLDKSDHKVSLVKKAIEVRNMRRQKICIEQLNHFGPKLCNAPQVY